jgi:3-methyladenine DNA glycosylase AlkD
MILDDINKELKAKANEENIAGQTHYFKEPIRTFGWKNGDLHKFSAEKFDKKWSKEQVFEYCDKLWEMNYMEHCFVACDWCYNMRKQFVEADFKLFESWVKNYISNWATCDTFCNHSMGEFVVKFPDYVAELKKWSKSNNRWVKRASAVSLIIPAKKGLFLKDIFEIADTMLMDEDDMVQKGYGWALKCAGQSVNLNEVYNFVLARKERMPRTAYRYAIEKFPTDMRKKAMEK